MLTALINNLPGFFDRNPQPDLALRVRHPAGLRWHVACTDLLTLSPDGLPETVIDLRAFTLSALATHLAGLGFTVPYLNPDLAPRQASVLLSGNGDQDRTDGDHLYAFRSILWAHLKALDLSLAAADEALAAMLRQLILPQAQESWADYWGYYFGMPRLTGETDSAYTQRIIDEFYRARNNPVAMRRNVKRYTGADIELFEPWTRMWTLSQSALSGEDHLPSGNFYAYHWLQPVARQPGINWSAVLPVLHADRPAGTLLVDPAYWLPPYGIDASAGHQIASAARYTRSSRVWLMNCGILDVNLALSAHCVTRNWQASIFDWFTSSLTALQTEIASIAYRRTFCLGEIVLSEAPPLGTLQAHFPGRRWIETGDPLILSQNSLSDTPYGGYWLPIDEWIDQTSSASLTMPEPELQAGVPQSIRGAWLDFSASISTTRYALMTDAISVLVPRTWTGAWDSQDWRTASRLPDISMTTFVIP